LDGAKSIEEEESRELINGLRWHDLAARVFHLVFMFYTNHEATKN